MTLEQLFIGSLIVILILGVGLGFALYWLGHHDALAHSEIDAAAKHIESLESRAALAESRLESRARNDVDRLLTFLHREKAAPSATPAPATAAPAPVVQVAPAAPVPAAATPAPVGEVVPTAGG